MGWWSKELMGGDSPLDAKDAMYSICGVNEFPGDSHVDLSKEDFEKNMDEILNFCRGEENSPYYAHRAIAFQVLGVLMMKCGAPINDELKKEIIENSQTDYWAENDDERKEIVRNFEQTIEKYDGTPIEIKSKGLFEAIAEHLAAGNAVCKNC